MQCNKRIALDGLHCTSAGCVNALYEHRDEMRFIPRPHPEPVKVCSRCNLQTPEKFTECVHCSNLTDSELQKFLEDYQKQLKGNANLGRYFAMTAVIVFILMVLGVLNS